MNAIVQLPVYSTHCEVTDMICKNCKKQLPDKSEFCPYCMKKFTVSKASDNLESNKKKSKKSLLVVFIALFAVIAVVLTVVFFNKSNNDNEPINNVSSSSSATQTTASTTRKSTETTTTKTTTSTAKSTTAKPSTTTHPSNSFLANEYKNIIKSYPEAMFNEYFLYDMNSDGIYELIIDYGNGIADREYIFYTYSNGSVKSVGSFNGGHGTLYAPKSGKGLINFGGNMGSYGVQLYTLDGTRLSFEQIASGEVESYQSYDDIALQYCGAQIMSKEFTDLDYLFGTLK